jgi:hypothetical protein
VTANNHGGLFPEISVTEVAATKGALRWRATRDGSGRFRVPSVPRCPKSRSLQYHELEELQSVHSQALPLLFSLETRKFVGLPHTRGFILKATVPMKMRRLRCYEHTSRIVAVVVGDRMNELPQSGELKDPDRNPRP